MSIGGTVKAIRVGVGLYKNIQLTIAGHCISVTYSIPNLLLM